MRFLYLLVLASFARADDAAPEQHSAAEEETPQENMEKDIERMAEEARAREDMEKMARKRSSESKKEAPPTAAATEAAPTHDPTAAPTTAAPTEPAPTHAPTAAPSTAAPSAAATHPPTHARSSPFRGS